MIVRELEVRYSNTGVEVDGRRITTPDVAASIFRELIGFDAQEVFCALLLDTRVRVLGYHEISRGTLTQSLVHPREVFKAAILANATAIIIGHNHPSGDPTPSPEDNKVTERMESAGKLIGIGVLDHVIIGEGSFHSYTEAK